MRPFKAATTGNVGEDHAEDALETAAGKDSGWVFLTVAMWVVVCSSAAPLQLLQLHLLVLVKMSYALSAAISVAMAKSKNRWGKNRDK